MKKWMILAAAVVLAAPVFAQTQEAFPSYIQVNGRSQMEVTPDEFYLSIVINERESKGKITVEIQQREQYAGVRTEDSVLCRPRPALQPGDGECGSACGD